ncbi:TrmB family transcriptional regulator [Kibdelosporangium philippinense]|uniref:TrmB family transcriptional regulator n=1 Tax=Kibdelosporangium philippinense TaxID=211113 RepID=A0ABS8ZW44_9PSEU|nr:LuxR family transcriptional regulator [Kibdelosporangium philippinense]MCE7011909.1 TrmB family transcriptional regulator [Kibdelosporangium philippinense]
MHDVASLTATEETAYRALLRLAAATDLELAEDLAIDPLQAAHLLLSLESRGMATVVPGPSGRYRPAPPDLAFGPLVQSREQELREIRARITLLTNEYRSRADPFGFVEVVHGSKAIAQRVDQLQRNARKEVRGLVKPPVVAVSAQDNDAEYAVLAQGVRFRVIYDRELLSLPGDPYEVSDAVSRGEEARVAFDLPLKLAIADEDLAIVPETEPEPGGEASAILVHPSGLLDALIALFETLWRSATPILLGASGELDEDHAADEPTAGDMRLISLLLAGLTDQSIAAQLGLSTRTVQRRLHDLIKITGVRTRIQLIWQATKRGWI